MTIHRGICIGVRRQPEREENVRLLDGIEDAMVG